MECIFCFFSALKFCVYSRFHEVLRRFSLWLIFFITIFSVSCFQENFLQKLEDYNRAFEVLSLSPANGAVSVSVKSSLSVQFTDNIDMTSVNASTFVVNGGSVSGVYSYDPLLKTVTFNPDSDLSYSTLYTVSLTSGIKGVPGNSMSSDYTWSFNTAPLFYIDVVSVLPLSGAVGVPVISNIEVIFDDNVDMLTVDDGLTFLVNGGAITGVFTYDSTGKTVIFNPDADLTPLTLYTVNLTTGIKNVSGNTMATNYTWSFTTATAYQPGIYVLSPLNVNFGSGKTFDFGNLVNPLTREDVFTIGNSGTADLNIYSAVLSGTNSTEYEIMENPSALISPGGTTTVKILFKPNVPVAPPEIKKASLVITNNDPLLPSFLIKFTGLSLAAAEPELQITKNGIIMVDSISTADFGTVVLPGSVTAELVMYNIGSADLMVSGIVIGGTNPSLFSTDFGTLPAVLPAGSIKTFNIIFTPTGTVNARAEIVFQSNDSDELSFKIKLKGRVQ